MSTSTWRVPGYTIEEPLGRGATGEVWRGRVAATGEKVALKRIRLGEAERVRAARTEAAVLGALDHANLVRLHEVVTVGDAVVLVLDLAAGGSLAQLVRARGRLSPGEVISALSSIGAALAYAHTAGVVHGDVTPSNVLFTDFGLPLLADLGVARIVGDDTLVHSTPEFIDPSVAVGCVPTPASDVFMLGGVALFALTGEQPWSGESPEATCAHAASGELGDVGARLQAAGVPDEIAEVICRALCLQPQLRCTAAEFALDLRHAGTAVAVELAAGRERVAPVPPSPSPSDGRSHSDGRPPSVGRHAAAVPSPASGPSAGRPAFDRPGLTQLAPVPSALPLTHGVRLRPLAARRQVMPWHLRRGARPTMVVLAVAVVAALAGFLALRLGARDTPAGAAPAPNRSAPNRSAPSQSVSNQSVPATAQAEPDAAAVLSELGRLDALRAQAFGHREPALLARVYGSPLLFEQDNALLLRLVPTGCGLTGLHTTFGNLSVTGRSPTSVSVRVDATLGPSALICHGAATGEAPGAGSVTLHIELARSALGYRIAAENRL
jgi:serine/threonine protein kinase